jgi:chromosome segregation ATPase
MKDRYLFTLIIFLFLATISFFLQLSFLLKDSDGERERKEVLKQKEERAIEELSGEIAFLKREMEIREDEIKTLSEEIRRLNEKNRSLEKERREGEEAVRDLLKEIERLEREKEEMRKRNLMFAAKLSEAEDEIESRKDEARELEERVKEREGDILQLRKRLAEEEVEKEKRMRDLEEREIALQKRIIKLQKEVASLQEKRLSAEEEIELLASAKEGLEKEKMLIEEEKKRIIEKEREFSAMLIESTEKLILSLKERRVDTEEMESILSSAKEAHNEERYTDAIELTSKSALAAYYKKAKKEERDRFYKAGLAGTILNILLLWR